MRTDNVLKAFAMAVLVPSMIMACGDDSPVGGGGSATGGGGSDPTGGSGGTTTVSGGGGEGAGGSPALNDDCATAAPIEVAPGDSVSVQGSMRGAQDDYTTFCGDHLPGESAADLMYVVTTTGDCSLELNLQADFDGVISARPVCAEDSGYCFNASTTNNEIGRYHQDGGVFYVMVSDFDGSGGDFTLSIQCTAPECGDSVVNADEDCDIGDVTPGDGCDANCLYEPSDPAIDTCGGAEAAMTNLIALNDSIKIPDTGLRSTIGAGDSGTGSCMYAPAPPTTNASGDHIYKITPEANGQLTITLGNLANGSPACGPNFPAPEPLPPYDPACWDRAIHVRTDCGEASTEVACKDSQTAGWWDTETVTFPVTANTDYFVFVDGYLDYGDGSDEGEYVLEAALAP